jgi:hypothetical protein
MSNFLSKLEQRAAIKRRRDRKAHPPSAPNPVYTGPMFPLIITGGGPGFDQIERDDLVQQIRQHLEMVLYTRPQEIISDINFGVGIQDYLFANELEHRVKTLQTTIQQQISQYIEYLSDFLVVVDTSDLHNNALGIQIRYRVDNLIIDEVAAFVVIP